MPEFRYTALDEKGREVTGAVQAENRSGAVSRLKGMGMYPMALDAVAAANGAAALASPAAAAVPGGERRGIPFFGSRVSPTDLSIFTRQLSSLFQAGLNMVRCLDTLLDHAESPALRAVLDSIKRSVQSGSSLWEAMAEHPKVFTELYISLVRAGETSGQLGKVLERLATSLEEQQEYQSKMRSALAYPLLLVTVGFASVTFIMLFLVPRFATIFADLNKELPAPTVVLLTIQGFITQYGWYCLALGIVAGFALRAWLKTEGGGLAFDRFRMRLWIVGSVVHKEAVARFCRTMATLVQGGVPILTSFDVAERAVGNRVLRQAIVQVKEAVREGETLAEPLRRTGVFPNLVTNMIAVGEETGNLDEMLNRIADAYDAEVSNRMRGIIALAEPVVILVVGSIIGAVILSMMIPIMNLSTAF